MQARREKGEAVSGEHTGSKAAMCIYHRTSPGNTETMGINAAHASGGRR